MLQVNEGCQRLLHLSQRHRLWTAVVGQDQMLVRKALWREGGGGASCSLQRLSRRRDAFGSQAVEVP
ncbi:MAG: hypothetical protein FJ077_04205 [Cyanobacteria bacterium K_DeepCast_35m_m2_023]|nr:hypothetical protein [Cyanobacteria bacterium K_DeepCast_35m_m2_023]